MRKSRRTGDNLHTSAGQQLLESLQTRSCDREGIEVIAVEQQQEVQQQQQRPQPAPRLSLTSRNLSIEPPTSSSSLYNEVDAKNVSSGSKNDSGITMQHFNSFSSGDGNAGEKNVLCCVFFFFF
jgi:hypothetical protein